MASSEPLDVSIIVPYYEGEVYLPKLANTLLGQGAGEVIVIVDGGYGEAAVREALAPVQHLRVVATPRALGTAGARNLGASLATGVWITFLDQDDWWPDRFIEELAGQASGDVVAYDNDVHIEAEEGATTPVAGTIFERAGWTRSRLSPADAGELLSGFPMVKLLVRRNAFVAVGGYRSKVYAVEDFDLVWRLLAAGLAIRFVHEPRGVYLIRSGSTTGQVAQGDTRSFLRAQRTWVGVWLRFSRTRRFSGYARLRALGNAARHAAKIVRVQAKLALRRAA